MLQAVFSMGGDFVLNSEDKLDWRLHIPGQQEYGPSLRASAATWTRAAQVMLPASVLAGLGAPLLWTAQVRAASPPPPFVLGY